MTITAEFAPTHRLYSIPICANIPAGRFIYVLDRIEGHGVEFSGDFINIFCPFGWPSFKSVEQAMDWVNGEVATSAKPG